MYITIYNIKIFFPTKKNVPILNKALRWSFLASLSVSVSEIKALMAISHKVF